MVINKNAAVKEEKPKVVKEAPAQEKQAKPKKVKVGVCEFCGAKTKGGRFCPGHDSKLKSQLIKAYKSKQDPNAKKELLERGWATEDYFAGLDTKIAEKKAKEAAKVKAKEEKEKAKAEGKNKKAEATA